MIILSTIAHLSANMAFNCRDIGGVLTLLLLLNNCITTVFCDCTVSRKDIDIESAESPLILTPRRDAPPYSLPQQSDGYTYTLKLLYPQYTDKKCLQLQGYSPTDALLSLACPGHSVQFPNFENFPSSSISLTTLIRDNSVFVSPYKPTLYIPEYSMPFTLDNLNSPIKCSGIPEPSMKKNGTNTYNIGYYLNALDFLSVIDLLYKDNIICAHANVLSVIRKKPKNTDDVKYKKGLLYDEIVNITELYNRQYPLAVLQEILEDKSLAEKYTSNYLVAGQLISKVDLFYIPEQRCTFFMENTVPIWKSINDGNWKKVGDIIRTMAHETITDFDVYSGAIDALAINNHTITLGTGNIKVPKILFKAVLDKKDSKRGIVFITINDPEVKEDEIADAKLLCNKRTECDQLYPEFLVSEKGYTYCCGLEEFVYWNKIKDM